MVDPTATTAIDMSLRKDMDMADAVVLPLVLLRQTRECRQSHIHLLAHDRAARLGEIEVAGLVPGRLRHLVAAMRAATDADHLRLLVEMIASDRDPWAETEMLVLAETVAATILHHQVVPQGEMTAGRVHLLQSDADTQTR